MTNISTSFLNNSVIVYSADGHGLTINTFLTVVLNIYFIPLLNYTFQ